MEGEGEEGAREAEADYGCALGRHGGGGVRRCECRGELNRGL